MQSRSLGECYVGVASCGNNTAEALRLVDRVKTYTNLLVVQSGPVSRNETAINEICDYAVASGLKVIVYFGDLNPVTLKEQGTSWRNSWVLTAKDCWGFWGGRREIASNLDDKPRTPDQVRSDTIHCLRRSSISS